MSTPVKAGKQARISSFKAGPFIGEILSGNSAYAKEVAALFTDMYRLCDELSTTALLLSKKFQGMVEESEVE